MKAGVIFTGSGPILILTNRESLDHPDLLTGLREKGISKYIAFEVPLDLVKLNYGQHFAVVMHDTTQTDVLRVVDVDGQRIFNDFALQDLYGPLCHEDLVGIRRKAA